MNLVLLEPSDFMDTNRVQLAGRRLEHVLKVHRAEKGTQLRVGLVNGKLGLGVIERIDSSALEMRVQLDTDPPAALPLRLILALPRPKVLNRTIAAAASMGIREIDIINAWRVEKAYWDSPRLSQENLRLQSIFGLEQACDTMLPSIRLHKLFTPFVREQLPEGVQEKIALLANPGALMAAPRHVTQPVILAIGPEGGFIDREVETFRDIGFTEVSLGSRVLRVETALAFLIGRLF
jgi:16S rRNA (uracil1498-N3)-methyltransferase